MTKVLSVDETDRREVTVHRSEVTTPSSSPGFWSWACRCGKTGNYHRSAEYAKAAGKRHEKNARASSSRRVNGFVFIDRQSAFVCYPIGGNDFHAVKVFKPAPSDSPNACVTFGSFETSIFDEAQSYAKAVMAGTILAAKLNIEAYQERRRRIQEATK